MKLCWDNITDLVYIKSMGIWRKKYLNGHRAYFYYVEACDNCGDPYLQRRNRENKRKHFWCSKECAFSSKFYKDNMLQNRKKNYAGHNHPQWTGGKSTVWFETYHERLEVVEQTRRAHDNHSLLEVKCTYCGKWYKPTTDAVVRRLTVLSLNPSSRTHGEARLYCSTECKKACSTFGQHTYPKEFKPATSREVQPQLRKLVLERDNWTCQKCGSTDNELHCHHIDPVINNPVESADVDNCVILCKECHEAVHKLPGCNYQELTCKEN